MARDNFQSPFLPNENFHCEIHKNSPVEADMVRVGAAVGWLCDRRVLEVVKAIVEPTRTQCEKVSYSIRAARSKIPSSTNRAREQQQKQNNLPLPW
eukprot:scaffold190532_cov33-Attheya_sp.AAC.1